MNLATARRPTGPDLSHAVALAARVGRQNAERMMGVCLSDVPTARVVRKEFVPIPRPQKPPEMYGPPAPVVPTVLHAERVRKTIMARAQEYGVAYEDVVGPSRLARFVRPRQMAMLDLHQGFKMSLSQIGSFFSNRDHTTVLHGIRKARLIPTQANPSPGDAVSSDCCAGQGF